MSNDKIKLIEKDEAKLYSYLVDLAKSDKGVSNIDLFEKYLHHESDEIKSASFFALLNVLKVDNEIYKYEALKYIGDKEADFDLRQWCVSGLAKTYFGSKNIELLKIFFNHLNDPLEDKDIKPALLRGMLGVFGMESRDVFLKVGVMNSVDETILESFTNEINEIKRIVE